MNKKDMLKEMGNISPEFIEEANVPAKRKSPILKWVAAAACFALVCTCVAIPLSKGWGEDTPMVETGIGTTPTGETKPTGLSEWQYTDESGAVPGVKIDPAETELVLVKKWDEMPDNERYGTIEDAAYNRYFVTHSRIDSRYVGEPLTDATARGYDTYEDKYHHTKVSLNCIANVDKDAAICVKYENSEGYYIFTNTNRTYKTLGEFSDALGLSHYLTLAGDATLLELNNNNDPHIYVFVESIRLRHFALTDEDAMLRLLLESRDAAAVNYTDYLRNRTRSYVNFPVNCLSTGQKNVSLSVYAEGYLVTNVGETGKCFFIGEEQAKKILDYIVANGEEKPWEPADPPASTVVDFPEKTTPPYNPTEKTKPPYHTSVDTTPAILWESTRTDWETVVPTYTTGIDKPETTRIASTGVVVEGTTCAYTRVPEETKPVYTGGTVILPETTPRFLPSSEDYPVFTETTCETAMEYVYPQ